MTTSRKTLSSHLDVHGISAVRTGGIRLASAQPLDEAVTMEAVVAAEGDDGVAGEEHRLEADAAVLKIIVLDREKAGPLRLVLRERGERPSEVIV